MSVPRSSIGAWLARLPDVPRLGRLGPELRRLLLLYAAYALVVFLTSLLATFPTASLVRSIATRTIRYPATIDFARARLGPTLAVTIDELRVRDGDPTGDAVVAIRSLRVAPRLLGLWRGDVYPLRIDAAAYGGTLHGIVDPRASAFNMDVSFTGLDLGHATGMQRILDGAFRGTLEGEIALRGARTTPTTLNGRTTFVGRALAIEELRIRGITMPSLRFDEVRLQANIVNGRVEIRELRATGDELRLEGAGTALLRSPLAATLINVTLTVTPAAEAPEGLRVALTLLPGSSTPDGARTLQLTGPVGQLQAR